MYNFRDQETTVIMALIIKVLRPRYIEIKNILVWTPLGSFFAFLL